MTGFEALVEAVRERLAGPLPGHAAHAEMAPFAARHHPTAISVEHNAGRPAATLVLLYPDAAGAAHLVLTVRQSALRAHAGQVSLPGGCLEPGESPEDAARREAFEEVGVPWDAPDVLGRLTPLYVPPSGFSVWPIVAAVRSRPAFVSQEAEVAALVEVPLVALLAPGARRRVERALGARTPGEPAGRRAEVPAFVVAGLEVWGATAMMLAELAAVAGPAYRSTASAA